MFGALDAASTLAKELSNVEVKEQRLKRTLISGGKICGRVKNSANRV